MIDFLEYWLIIRKPQSRPSSTQGWRQAWRNWCRIERERSEGAKRRGGETAKPGQPIAPSPRRPLAPSRAATEEQARAAIANLKDRFGWAPSAHQPISPSASEEEP
jgi:hypothetical protein